MKEFVENLIERLEKELYLADKDKKEANVLQFDRAVGYANGVSCAIDIISQLAEIDKSNLSGNLTGWIPCSERLPEESGYYLACVYNSDVDDFDFRKIWFANADDYIMDESEWRELYEFEIVTAWQPLPEPYKEQQKEIPTEHFTERFNRVM